MQCAKNKTKKIQFIFYKLELKPTLGSILVLIQVFLPSVHGYISSVWGGSYSIKLWGEDWMVMGEECQWLSSIHSGTCRDI